MSYVVIDNFNLGLDDRRSLLTAKPGTLSRLENAHITRGGEIERRKEFGEAYVVTYGYGLQATDSGLYQFGSTDYSAPYAFVANSGPPVFGFSTGYPAYPSVTTQKTPSSGYDLWVKSIPASEWSTYISGGYPTTFADETATYTFSKDSGSAANLIYGGFHSDIAGCISRGFNNVDYMATAGVKGGEWMFAVFKVGSHNNNDELLNYGGNLLLKQGTTSGEFIYDLNGVSLSVSGLSLGTWYLYSQRHEGDTSEIKFYALDSSVESPTMTVTGSDSGTASHVDAVNDSVKINQNANANSFYLAELLVYDDASDVDEDAVLDYFTEKFLTPTLPKVKFQRLQHPDGSTAMSSVEFSTVFNGKAFVVAKFADGSYQAFYNGTIIPDFYAGQVRSDHADIGEMLAEIASEINASASGQYLAGVGNDDTLGIERIDGTEFTVSVTDTDGGGTDDADIQLSTETEATPQVGEVKSEGRVLIQNGAASDTINTLTVGGVSLISSAVTWATDDVNTAKLLAEEINSSTPATGSVSRIELGGEIIINWLGRYPAGGEYYIGTPKILISDVSGGSGSGATAEANMVAYTAYGYNGSTWGNHTFYRIGSISITAAGSGYTGPITVTVDTVDSGAATVLNGLSESTKYGTKKATAVGYIADGSGKPVNYTARASGAYVIISGDTGTGEAPNGETIAATTTGSITVTQTEEMGAYQAGAYPIAGSNQKSNITFGGTLEAGDKYRVVLTDENGDTFVAGGSRVLGITPITAKSFKQKLYLAAGGNLYYSALDDATEWESDSDGSGVINMQTEFSDYSGIKAVTTYQNNLAVFSRRSGQIWFVDPDDSLNQQIQVLENIGALSPGSAVTMGDSDVLFVSDFGIRSLRVRDSSNAAFVSDVGTPIDKTIISEIASMTEAQVLGITSGVEPKDGRYFAFINDKIYVLSFFPGSKISAWSTYTLNYGSSGDSVFDVDKFESFDGNFFILNDKEASLWGGIHVLGYDGTTSDNGVGTGYTTYVETPYLDAGRPGDLKRWTGIDMAATGDWDVFINCDPQNEDAWERIARGIGTTAGLNKIAFDAHSTHVRFKFQETADTQSKISNLIVHFEQLNEE